MFNAGSNEYVMRLDRAPWIVRRPPGCPNWKVTRSTRPARTSWAGAIAQSRLVICDLTGRNANVLYESGLAHALNCDVILVTQTIEDVPFDLRQFRVIKYLPNREGLSKLTTDLEQTIQETLQETPRRG